MPNKGKKINYNPISLKNLIRGFKKGHTSWLRGKRGLQPWHNISGLLNISTEERARRGFKKGYKPSIETRKKISEALKGEKHWNWKGGVSKDKKQYFDLDYKLWREAVFERDNYTCQMCGAKGSDGVYLTAHHIKSWRNFPELRYEIENGITLCENCHSKTDNYKGRARRKISC